VSEFTLLAFLEFLVESSLSVASIKNYFSAIKSYFMSFNIPVNNFASHQLTLALTSLTKNSIPVMSCKPILSPSQFKTLLYRSTFMPMAKFYNLAYILGYLGLLRISNVAPKSRGTFDPLRDLRRGDLIITNNVLYINLRWTKTLQKHNQTAQVPLFPINNSIACPITAFNDLQRSFPVLPNDPLLSYRVSGSLYMVTQPSIRAHLRKLVTTLAFNKAISFHALRRSGASLAFSSGVPFTSIQAHGTWTSDALWAYIDPQARDPAVPQCFSTIFSSL
jgi:integrase